MQKVLALIFMITLGTSSAGLFAQNSNELAVGQVFGNEVGQVVNGWEHVGGSLFYQRQTKNYVTTEVTKCCVASFKRGNTYLFAHTSPVARRATGGVEAERIVKMKKFTLSQNERTIDCNLIWITPVQSFYNSQTRVIRSIIFDGADFIEIKWFAPDKYCSLGD